MARPDKLVRAVPADLLLLEASVARAGIAEEFVRGAFWWEYLRSSPAAVQDLQQRINVYIHLNCDFPGTRIIGPGFVKHYLLHTALFGFVHFPQLSWREAMHRWSLGKVVNTANEEFPKRPITVAQLWAHWCGRRVGEPLTIGRSFSEIDDFEDPLFKGPTDTFLMRANWRFSDVEMTRAFSEFLRKKRPPLGAIRAPHLGKPWTSKLPVRPRSALGWLFVQRAYAELGSWNALLDRYGRDFRRLFGAVPDEKELMARRRRAFSIIGWYSRGATERPR